VSLAGVQRLTTRWFGGWTLRARLLAALIVLLALICLIVGVVTQVVARSYLVAQVDTRLSTLPNHAAHMQPGTSPPDFVPAAGGGSPLAIGAIFNVDGRTQSGVVNANGYGTTAATTQQIAALQEVPVDGQAHTIHLPNLGDYRATAAPAINPGPDKHAFGTAVLALPLSTVNASLVRLGITELCVTIAGLIAVGLVGEIIIRRTLRPLNRVAAIATRVSEMELDRGEVALKMRVQDTDPRTEIGQVGASLNRMLGHVSNALAVRQASEVRVRQFVADASHELRTPLAAIRGYAELTRHAGAGTVSEDVAHAMRRVESESARMTTLVEDLLLLASLDAGRPLVHSEVDLSMLVVDVVSDAHIAGGQHEWSLELPDGVVTVTGDGPRLHQVIANLLGNARVHTPAGTKVTVALAPQPDGSATISVTDNGPGIPESLLPEVFERFARGDSSRSRAAGSTGLGLAIVAAVVEAHGGTVEVTSYPGRTAFVVTLPPKPPAAANSAAANSAAANSSVEPAVDLDEFEPQPVEAELPA
jgi:two-component system, OmpR family, sensor kinase